MAEEIKNNNERSTITGRVRKASFSTTNALLNFNPQPGMWAATGTAIAYAPTLTELREPVAGGENIEFDEHGRSARIVVKDNSGAPVLALSRTRTRTGTGLIQSSTVEQEGAKGTQVQTQNQQEDVEKDQETPAAPQRAPTLAQQAKVLTKEKHNWKTTTQHGLTAAWKFVSTPTGFLMTLYGLNIVAWGAMLFFLLLGAAPAMNHPSKDADNSPRKKWLEIDSQILNALFCVTGFGLAPWRFRDLWWLVWVRFGRNREAMRRLSEQNASWFRPPTWYTEGNSSDVEGNDMNVDEKRVTFTGELAPPTRLWKLSFVVWMMVWNTLFQAVLAAMMWGYNRFDRPTWSTGTFIGLGCGVSLLAGVMMWWEGRKIKKIEGPIVKVVDAVDGKTAEGV
ncbi:hypothetical protein BKA65DRAFT_496236 [Rhexocercosporidium sp. MPI-PUGE-AT-0058]|nr:hypothetical protein BKA65DRAFT_496236 [Rhexocercosporidium sp. MPI-PUGE-AT-0058]